MRDLLYLSENKMRALIPQLPGQLRRRLGFEAGLNAGVVSAKATLQSESQPSSVALLDAVVEMIERGKGSRWRTDSDLRAGDWIQFEEEFRYGDAPPGLVYFAAADRGLQHQAAALGLRHDAPGRLGTCPRHQAGGSVSTAGRCAARDKKAASPLTSRGCSRSNARGYRRWSPGS